LRGMLLPPLDGKVSPKERAGIAECLVRAKVENREQAAAELVASDDLWPARREVLTPRGLVQIPYASVPPPMRAETSTPLAAARAPRIPSRKQLSWQSQVYAPSVQHALIIHVESQTTLP